MIEITGVLLIISLLAAAIIPAMMRQLDAAARTKEAKDLSTLAASLQTSILRQQQIPDAAGWVAAVASELAAAPNTISTNQRRFARAYLINPNLSLARSGATNLPYLQGSAGVARPANATVILVGSTRGHLPVASGVLSSADFTELWNTPTGQRPGSWTSYAGSAEDLIVQRVNLEPLFYRFILDNLATNGQPSFQIGTNALVALSPNNPARVSYYLDGTVVGLYDTNASPNLLAREILRADTYRVFDETCNCWREEMLKGRSSNLARDLGRISGDFLSAPSPGNKWDATPKGTATIYYSFMFAYSAWASETPCFRYDGNGNSKFAPQQIAIDGALDAFKKSGNLMDAKQ